MLFLFLPLSSTTNLINNKLNKIRDLFKVKLYIIRSETKKKERERERKEREREGGREKREREREISKER